MLVKLNDKLVIIKFRHDPVRLETNNDGKKYWSDIFDNNIDKIEKVKFMKQLKSILNNKKNNSDLSIKTTAILRIVNEATKETIFEIQDYVICALEDIKNFHQNIGKKLALKKVMANVNLDKKSKRKIWNEFFNIFTKFK